MGVLTQLLYFSVSNIRGDADAVEAAVTRILSSAYRNNRQRGLTGILFHCDQYFAQLIEGPAKVVHGAMQVIRQDPRHRDIDVLFEREIAEPWLPRAAVGCAGLGGDCARIFDPAALARATSAERAAAAESLVEYLLAKAREDGLDLAPNHSPLSGDELGLSL